jgi:tRNA 2-thiouridine synthesizing protein A
MSPGDAPTADLTVDATGKFCPVPILEVARAIRGVRAGQIVQVVATDPGVEEDMVAWCKATRNELVALLREGKTYRAFVRRSST